MARAKSLAIDRKTNISGVTTMISKLTHCKARGKLTVVLICFLLCCVLVSCESDQAPQNTDTINESDYPVTGHILYGYKHGIKVYGQYMDQAGDNNAMILVFVEKESDCAVDLLCKSISINDTQVTAQFSTDNISDQLTAIEVYVSSAKTEVDELQEKDTVSLSLEIADSNSGQILEVTAPITFPCN